MNRSEINTRLSTRRYTTISVCGVELRVQSLNSREYTSWNASKLDDKGDFSPERAELARERLIALCVVDENDRLMYPDKKDVGLISDWGETAVATAFDLCFEHNRKVTESIAKN